LKDTPLFAQVLRNFNDSSIESETINYVHPFINTSIMMHFVPELSGACDLEMA